MRSSVEDDNKNTVSYDKFSTALLAGWGDHDEANAELWTNLDVQTVRRRYKAGRGVLMPETIAHRGDSL